MKEKNEKTLLQALRDNLDNDTKEEWIKYCNQRLKECNKLALADLLRDISIELRPSSIIDEHDRSALEKLKNTLLNVTLQNEQQSNINKIKHLKTKINDAPDDVGKSIQAKLASVEKDALEDNELAPLQDRIANSEKVEKSIIALKDQFDLEYRRKTLDADMEDRKQERSVKRFQSFAQKESIANLLGGLLLLVFSVVLISSMFISTNKESLEIIKGAFLILLGFFFGQNTKAEKKKGE